MGDRLSYTKRQMKERPDIRQVARNFLNGELYDGLEGFVTYLEANKAKVSVSRANTYENKYKANVVFRIEIALGQACRNDVYAIRVYTAANPMHFREERRNMIEWNLNSYVSNLDADMGEYFLAHLPNCRGCGKCRPGVALNILGREFSHICACDMFAMRVTNPDERDMEFIKRFIEARRRFIAGDMARSGN